MTTRIALWGNSFGVRISRGIARQLGVRPGSRLRIAVRRGRLVCTPAVRKAAPSPRGQVIRLAALVRRVTSANRPDDACIDDGPQGREAW